MERLELESSVDEPIFREVLASAEKITREQSVVVVLVDPFRKEIEFVKADATSNYGEGVEEGGEVYCWPTSEWLDQALSIKESSRVLNVELDRTAVYVKKSFNGKTGYKVAVWEFPGETPEVKGTDAVFFALVLL